MFDRDGFVAACRQALDGDRASRNVREVMASALSDPASVVRGLGPAQPGGIDVLHRAPDLTVINVHWRPNMVVMPHNHGMWAVIGVYDGREDNIMWRRLPDDANGRIEAAGAKSLSTGDSMALGADIVHSVLNPIGRISGAIHVYGGDFFGIPRSEWDPESLTEMPYDMEKVLRMFQS